jgi:hypothetical protein
MFAHKFSRKKMNIFCVPYKKTIFDIQNMTIYMTFFLYFLHRPYKMFICPENLCATIECPYVHANIFLKFCLTFFYFVFSAFDIIGSYTPMCQNTTSKFIPLKYIIAKVCTDIFFSNIHLISWVKLMI